MSPQLQKSREFYNKSRSEQPWALTYDGVDQECTGKTHLRSFSIFSGLSSAYKGQQPCQITASLAQSIQEALACNTSAQDTQEPLGILWWLRLHPLYLSLLESQYPSPAGLVRVSCIVMATLTCIGSCRGQASLLSSWYIGCPTLPQESQTGSVAVGQELLSHWESVEWRLRMWVFITVCNI